MSCFLVDGDRSVAWEPVQRAANLRCMVSQHWLLACAVQINIYPHSLAFLHEIKRNALPQGPHQSVVSPSEANEPASAEQFMSSMARQNLAVLTKALQRMEQFWAGIAYVLSILDERVAGEWEYDLSSCLTAINLLRLSDKH